MLQVKLFLTVRQFAILFSTLVNNLFKPAIPKVNDQSLSKGLGQLIFYLKCHLKTPCWNPLKLPLLKCIVIRFQTKTNFLICVLKQF